MSYDLFFELPAGMSLEDVAQFFSARPHYSVQPSQALYENQHTGYSFVADLVSTLESPDDAVGFNPPFVVFHVNYLRPRTYCLEVLVEIEAYLAKFPGRFHDEATGETAAFDDRRFLALWQKTNVWALRETIKPDAFGETDFFAPTELVEHVWRWNAHRAGTQESFGDQVFVPGANWHRAAASRTVEAAVVWTDLIPIIIPLFIERIVIVRTLEGWSDRLGRLLGRQNTAKLHYRIVPATRCSRPPHIGQQRRQEFPARCSGAIPSPKCQQGWSICST